MKVKTFFIGIIATFALPWLCIVIIPFYSMKNRSAAEYSVEGVKKVYTPLSNLYTRGAEIYQQENCQACHTQVIRNSYAGSEIFRKDWAGKMTYDEKGILQGDTRRESISWDYRDKFASIGERRTGPDLINFRVRIKSLVDDANKTYQKEIAAGEIKPFTIEELVYLHLYDPRHDTAKEVGLERRSNCASNKHMFKRVSSAGQGAVDALPIVTESGYQIVPGDRAKALMYYLVGLERDDKLPKELSKAEQVEEEAAE